MMQYAFYVDSSSCTGCKTCQVACQDKNNLPASMIWRRVLQYGNGSWEDKGNGLFAPKDIFRYFISVGCNHCIDPACVKDCPTGAMQKDEETGIVWTDHDVCIACSTCVKACPYGAPELDTVNNYMTKCDLCMDQIKQGGKPECVDSCNQRALDFGTLEEMQEKYPGLGADIEPLPIASTNPGLLINPHPKAQSSGKGTGSLLNMEYEI